MQPLATTRRMMTWLSMCPAEETSNAWQKMAYVVYTLVVLFINLICFTSSLVFCLKFISIDFDGAAFAFMIAIGEIGLIYFLIAAILMRYQIGSIFTSLSTIYQTNEKLVTFWYLAKANNTSEWVWSFFLKYIAISIAGVASTSLFSVLYCYLTQGDFSVDHFYEPGKFYFPWDQTTHAGYFGEICVSLALEYGYMIANGTPLLLFISLCQLHQAFSKMFKHSTGESVKCDAKLLCDLIRFHISAKDLFLDSANVFSSFVLVQLICSTVMMTVSVFDIDLQSQHFDFSVASVMITTSVGMSTLLFYCYFGKLATDSYEAMSDCVFGMNWHEQPNHLQRYFILMIANMQKPVYYHGFEVAKLDLQTFVQLFRKVFSFYVAIKAIAAK